MARAKRNAAGRRFDPATGRFLPNLKPRKSSGRRRAERTEDRIANAARNRASRQMKAYHARVRAYREAAVKAGEDLSYRAARKQIGGSLGESLVAAYNAPLRNIRFRKGKAYHRKSGKQLTQGQIRAMRERAMLEEIRWRISIRKGISYAKARKLISERYGGDWRAAMRKELYPPKSRPSRSGRKDG